MATESELQEASYNRHGHRRERPWLLPYNRRLRNLQGITLRNVTLHPKHVRRGRRTTIDDDALPYALKSPGKLVLKNEFKGWEKGVERSRSISDLKAVAEDPFQTAPPKNTAPAPLYQEPAEMNGELVNGIRRLDISDAKDGGDSSRGEPGPLPNGSPRVPSTMGKSRSGSHSHDTTPIRKASVRRRSTMDQWYESTPERQSRWCDAVSSHLLDVFFSLHLPDEPEPIYISEVMTDTMNPNFRHFDLADAAPSISRKESVVIKVWTKGAGSPGFRYLIELTADLRALQFIGKDLAHFHQPFPDNCVIFHLTDGIYTSLTDVPMFETLPSVASGLVGRPGDPRPPKPMSTYDQLMRLGTLGQCLQDMLSSRARFKSKLDDFITSTQRETEATRVLPFETQRALEVEQAVELQRKRNAVRKRQIRDLQDLLATRRRLMASGRAAMEKSSSEIQKLKPETVASETAVEAIQKETHAHRRRVCSDLEAIFPIQPTPGKSLSFTIGGLPLPDADEAFDAADSDVAREKLGAALGFVAQVLKMLSAYMAWPLPYPIEPQGSTSWIEDPISAVPGDSAAASTAAASVSRKNRKYPLFVKGVPRFRAEYALFLLNKDIEILAQHMGLRLLDIRQTLPNLKYILFVATAGEGELPERKKGGVRGLGTAFKSSGVKVHARLSRFVR